MAHKHNRRRVRPRNRRNNAFSFTSEAVPLSLESFMAPSWPSPASLPTERFISPTMLFPSNSSVVARHWQNRYTAWQNREAAQRREAAKIEAEQIKLFGGEPGDDVSLCYKMMEVFEGMNWVDT